jgi:hypothetical protein
MLYVALVRSKLEYVSVAITDSNKVERIQRQFAALCPSRFFQDIKSTYDHLLQWLYLLTLYDRRGHFDTLFLIKMSSVALTWPPLSPKQSAFRFLRWASAASTCSRALLATALRLDAGSTANAVYKLRIFLGTHIWVLKAQTDSCFFCYFFLCCHIAASVYAVQTLFAQRLLSSAHR